MIKVRIGRMNYWYEWTDHEYRLLDAWGWYGIVEHYLR